jgi:hypothetical protein
MELYQVNKVGVTEVHTSVYLFLPWQQHVCGHALS